MAQAKQYDLIVVGAGFAGLICAARIAEKGVHPKTGEKLKIALIEAGPNLLKNRQKHGFGDPLHRQMIPQILWEEFDTGGLLKSWPWTFGLKVVGGCSIHWGAHMHLPYDVDYENWSAMGISWTKKDMKEAVDDMVQTLHVHADPEEAWTPGERMFRNAAAELGYKFRDFDGAQVNAVEPLLTMRKNCIFCGFHNEGHGCKYDAKGTSLWYLPIAEANGVELIADAEVKKVNIEKRGAGGIVNGVTYEKNGQVLEARSDKVIVSCGWAGSPVLLGKSGYGPKDELGNDLIVGNDNVGRNWDGETNHSFAMLFDQPIKEAGRGTNTSICIMDVDRKYTDGTGTLRINTADLSSINYPHQSALSAFAPAFGKKHMDFMKTAITHLGEITLKCSRPPTHITGRVNVRTGAATYGGDPYIEKRMRDAREIAIELAKKMGAKYLERFPANFKGRGGGHPNGTCRAGSDRRNSVINGDFESHDVKGLFVVDAGSYPRSSINSGSFAALMGAFGARRIIATYFSRGL
ncbi:MAG: GMC family oxidoreductase [Acidobacteria bacterium]|nr:GMC family oxidoreductase [Acidobacteriota bacterium]